MLLERNLEASQKEVSGESAGRCQGATELVSTHEYMADPSSRCTGTGASGGHDKIPGGLVKTT